jgi:hypothetical protein
VGRTDELMGGRRGGRTQRADGPSDGIRPPLTLTEARGEGARTRGGARCCAPALRGCAGPCCPRRRPPASCSAPAARRRALPAASRTRASPLRSTAPGHDSAFASAGLRRGRAKVANRRPPPSGSGLRVGRRPVQSLHARTNLALLHVVWWAAHFTAASGART